MPTLLILSFTAFVIAGLAWFSTWAFWLHPPEGWLGRAASSAIQDTGHERVRRAPWFRAIKLATLLLGLLTVGLFVTMLRAH
jgi:hypothetical protein